MKKLISFFLAIVCLNLTLFAQTKTVSGKVTDDKNAPIAGASVVVPNTTYGTTTKADGTFSLSVPQATTRLAISAVNYAPQTVTIRNGVANASLVIAGQEIDEVVVTGIKTVKKSEYTGATTKVDKAIIESKPVGSFEQALQGRVAGLSILTGSGQPGQASNVIIRGSSSISGGNDALYIVDGIEVNAATFKNLNPNTFESVEVLRDASATALYGSRGSGGIIVATTKQGRPGKLNFTYRGQYGIKSKPDFAFRTMNTTELLKAQEDYGKIVGATASTTTLPGWYYSQQNPRYNTLTAAQKQREGEIIDSISKINTNWSDQIFRTGSFANHEIEAVGGTGKTSYFSNLGFYKEEGTTLRSGLSRVNLTNKLTFGNDKIDVLVSNILGYSRTDFQQNSDFNTSNPFATSALAVPYHLVYKPDGTFYTGTGTKYVGTNQLDQTFYDRNYNNQFKGVLNLRANYKLTKFLSAGIQSGIDFTETQSTNYGSKLVYTRITSSTPTGKAGFQYEGLSRFLVGTVRPNLTFNKTFAEKHEVEVSTYGEYIRRFSKTFGVQGYGTDPKRPNTIAAIQPANASNQLYHVVSGGKAQSSIVSGLVMGRYTFAKKYTLNGSFRADGASKLPRENRWTNYWSLGGVWDITREKFMDNVNAINVLRLRASYGGSGNENNFPGGYYPYQANYTGGSYAGLPTIVATTAGNPDLKWESTWTKNLGLDFEVAKRRIYGNVNVYDKRTKDLFVYYPLSSVAGFGNGASIDYNVGELQNKGIESELNIDVIKKSNLVWTLFGNVAYNKNKVLSLGGLGEFEVGTEMIKVGLPLGSHYEVGWAGVDQATGQPLYYDENGNITNSYALAAPVQKWGTSEAPWRGGFGTSVKFSGFELSTLFSWQKGGTKVDNLEYFMENPVGFLSGGYNQSASLNMWKKPGDIATTPSPLYGINFSSKLIHDASFLRLRDVTLAYTFDKDLIGKSKILSGARFFVQGTNLFMWTHWRGRDPEAGASNLNISEYPNPRAVTAGVSLTF